MANYRVWPNAEKHVISWLKSHTGYHIFTTLPTTLGAYLPAIKVARTGGSPAADTVTGSRTVGNDRTIDIEVTVFASDRGKLWDVVQQVETAMGGLDANGDGSWYVDQVTEIFAFSIDNYENEAKQRAIATYGLTVRPIAQQSPPPPTGVGGLQE